MGLSVINMSLYALKHLELGVQNFPVAFRLSYYSL